MILDDIEVPGNSMTELMRKKLLQLCTEAESILTPKADSRIMYLGTPQTTFTIYRKLAERSYKPFVWTARYPRAISKYEGLLAPQLVEDIDNGAEAWTVTDPDRFDNEDLIEREASMGRSNFMLQFMLDTSLSDAEKFPLKCADLVVTSVNPTSAPEAVVWCSDPSKCHQRVTNCRTTWGLFLLSNVITRRLEALTPRQSARLTRRVVAQMKQQRLISPSTTVSCTCTRCVLTEKATATIRYWTF